MSRKYAVSALTLLALVLALAPPRTGPGTANDGFPKYDLTEIDQNYINHFKGFVAEAATRNVVVIVDLFDSYHLNRDVATSFCNGPRGA